MFTCCCVSKRVNILNCQLSGCMCSCTEFAVDEIIFTGIMHTLDLWVSTSCDAAQSGKSWVIEGSRHRTKLCNSPEIVKTTHGRRQ